MARKWGDVFSHGILFLVLMIFLHQAASIHTYILYFFKKKLCLHMVTDLYMLLMIFIFFHSISKKLCNPLRKLQLSLVEISPCLCFSHNVKTCILT